MKLNISISTIILKVFETMKKNVLKIIIIAIFLIPFGILSRQMFAATPQPTTEGTDKKIQQLKEKLATQVAQLRENQKRGFLGSIAALTKTGFTIVTPAEEIKVKYTEDTLVFKLGKTKTPGSLADLKNNITASVLGLYNEDDKQHSAKVILLQSLVHFVSGIITNVDKQAATITLKNLKNEIITVDYEKNTLAEEYNGQTEKIAKSGLSRLVIGDHLEVWGVPDEEDTTKLSAQRILRIPESAFKEKDVVASPSASPKTTATPKASTIE